MKKRRSCPDCEVEMNDKDRESEERLDKLLLTAFGTNHPAVLDWVSVKMRLKNADLKLQQAVKKERKRYKSLTTKIQAVSNACRMVSSSVPKKMQAGMTEIANELDQAIEEN